MKPTNQKKFKKTSTNKGTPVGAASSSKFDLNAAVAAAAALVGQSAGGSTAVYTQQEGDAAVQAVYQQLLGRNAQGAEYNKALNLAMQQSGDTSATGRMQAIQNYVMSQPEYIARSQNRWLDAIYNDMQKKIARARQ